jgi:hypothetical protein
MITPTDLIHTTTSTTPLSLSSVDPTTTSLLFFALAMLFQAYIAYYVLVATAWALTHTVNTYV